MKKIIIKKKTKIQNLYVFESQKFHDNRGSFQRVFCKKELKKIIKKNIVQANISINPKIGTFRGLHYQVGKFSEDKLITCIQGSIFDIAVEIKNLKTKKCKIHTEILSDENKKMIYIPKGVAHGFQTLKKNTIVLYFHTNYHSANHQKTIGVKSKLLNIKLPRKITLISKKDNLNYEM